jgi:hypothetical protein
MECNGAGENIGMVEEEKNSQALTP